MEPARQAAFEARLKRHRARILPLRVLAARPRLLASATLGALAGFLTPENLGPVQRGLIGWDVALILYIALITLMMARSSRHDMPFRAKLADDGRAVILALACAASVVSIGAILFELTPIKNAVGLAKAGGLALAFATIILSWSFTHLEFAVHYAHTYYAEKLQAVGDDGVAKKPEARGGLIFPDCEAPLYLDFVYFSFVIGVAAQTADVAICSRAMRAIVLAHSVLCFFFNTTILALTINIAAGLV